MYHILQFIYSTNNLHYSTLYFHTILSNYKHKKLKNKFVIYFVIQIILRKPQQQPQQQQTLKNLNKNDM